MKICFKYLNIMLVIILVCLVLTSCDAVGDGAVKDDVVKNDIMEQLQLAGGEQTYTIVYDADCLEIVAKACESLNAYLGGNLAVLTDETRDGEETVVGDYEILIGATHRPESVVLSEPLGMFDYRIAVEGEKLIVAGGSDDALINAIAHLMRDTAAVSRDEDGSVAIARDYSFYFDGADSREEYIADPNLFLCNWGLEFDTPEWMLDYGEKLAAFRDPDGRMMALHHRGDTFHYPENSIEGIISAIRMGADCIEIDLRLTKDGVLVLMHDEDLNRTTDWVDKVGKNGLPKSRLIADWTYEELCQLRLNSGVSNIYTGGPKQTDYVIPTFAEVLQVCNGRTTLCLDKYGVWEWETDAYPLIQEAEAWTTCVVHSAYGPEKQGSILETIKEESGEDAVAWFRFDQEECENWRVMLDGIQEKGYLPMMYWGNFANRNPEDSVEVVGMNLEQIRDEARIHVDTHISVGGKEKPEVWDYLYENGINVVVVDNGLKFQKYLAENYEATYN